jgi:hypothetical protein
VVKLKITTLAEEEHGMNVVGPWEGGDERSQQQRRYDDEQSMLEREELSVEPNKRTRRMEGYQLPRRPYSPEF